MRESDPMKTSVIESTTINMSSLSRFVHAHPQTIIMFSKLPINLPC